MRATRPNASQHLRQGHKDKPQKRERQENHAYRRAQDRFTRTQPRKAIT